MFVVPALAGFRAAFPPKGGTTNQGRMAVFCRLSYNATGTEGDGGGCRNRVRIMDNVFPTTPPSASPCKPFEFSRSITVPSSQLGANTFAIEVTNISAHGLWLLVGEKEYFLSYDTFPWFKDARVSDILDVTLSQGIISIGRNSTLISNSPHWKIPISFRSWISRAINAHEAEHESDLRSENRHALC